MNQTPVGTRFGCTSNSVKTRNVASDANPTPRTAPHMSRVET